MKNIILKKLLPGIMTFTMLFALSACTSNETTQSQTSAQSQASESAESTEDVKSNETVESTEINTVQDNETQQENESETGKTLVVYFSATQNTEGVAQTIAEITGGDLFEIEPVEPYTDDDLNWTNDKSRVSVEHDNEDQRDVELVSTDVDGWESYDTVYIGYPIWWGIAAWPVNGFVEANDFTGKTVIPFCTSASSGIGDSGTILESLTETGTWLDGGRFSGGASADEIQEWIDELGL